MQELQNEIAGLLRGFHGEEPLKKLFWSALGYDRVEAAIPPRLLDGDLASKFHEVRLLAEYRGLHVVYARMTSRDDGPATMRALAGRVKQTMPYALLVFSDAGQAVWNLVFYRAGGEGEEIRHLRIGPDGDRTSDLAAQLARLRTYAKDGQDRPLAGLLNAFDAVFSRGRRQFEQSTQGRDGETPYWLDVRRYPRLSDREERDIVVRLTRLRGERMTSTQANREYLEARNALVCANLLLSAHFSMRLASKRQAQGLDLDDLIQLGNIGLIRAANNFDAGRGTKFSTYAVLAIKTNVWRAMIVYDALTRRVDATERPRLRRSVVDVSERHDLPDLRAANPESQLMRSEQRKAVRMAVDLLKPRERVVVLARFGLGGDSREQTFEELAKTIGMTRERVRQIEARAFERLRWLMNPGSELRPRQRAS